MLFAIDRGRVRDTSLTRAGREFAVVRTVPADSRTIRADLGVHGAGHDAMRRYRAAAGIRVSWNNRAVFAISGRGRRIEGAWTAFFDNPVFEDDRLRLSVIVSLEGDLIAPFATKGLNSGDSHRVAQMRDRHSSGFFSLLVEFPRPRASAYFCIPGISCSDETAMVVNISSDRGRVLAAGYEERAEGDRDNICISSHEFHLGLVGLHEYQGRSI